MIKVIFITLFLLLLLGQNSSAKIALRKRRGEIIDDPKDTKKK